MPLKMPTARPRPRPDRASPGRPADGGRHHRRGRQRPGHRKVDVAEQDDQHHPGGDDAQEGADLELLQQVAGIEEGEVALGRQRVGRAEGQDHQHEQARDRDRAVVGGELEHRRSAHQLQAVAHAEHPAGAERDRGQEDEALEQRLQQRRHVEDAEVERDRAQITRAPTSEPTAPPLPPVSAVPPMTTAAIELSV